MIQADTIVYEKSGVDACLAVLDGGQLREFEVFNETALPKETFTSAEL